MQINPGFPLLALLACLITAPVFAEITVEDITVHGGNLEGGSLERQDDIYAALAANAVKVMIRQYVPALESFNAIGVKTGTEDAVCPSKVRMHELLNRYGIEHQWPTYKDGHGEILCERIKNVMLTFLSRHLQNSTDRLKRI